MEDFYVYLYLREDGSPYYVGKGRKRRAYGSCRRVSPPKDKNRIVLLHTGLTEARAFELEIELIAKYGRKDLGTGILHNMSDGGEGSAGTSPETNWKKGSATRGKPVSEKTKEKLRVANLERDYPMDHTEEVREKMRQSALKAWENRPKMMTEEQKQKISDAMKRRWQLKKERGV